VCPYIYHLRSAGGWVGLLMRARRACAARPGRGRPPCGAGGEPKAGGLSSGDGFPQGALDKALRTTASTGYRGAGAALARRRGGPVRRSTSSTAIGRHVGRERGVWGVGAGLMRRLVPGVHRRAPRAAQSSFAVLRRAARGGCLWAPGGDGLERRRATAGASARGGGSPSSPTPEAADTEGGSGGGRRRHPTGPSAGRGDLGAIRAARWPLDPAQASPWQSSQTRTCPGRGSKQGGSRTAAPHLEHVQRRGLAAATGHASDDRHSPQIVLEGLIRRRRASAPRPCPDA
jgi:hypothetical protein